MLVGGGDGGGGGIDGHPGVLAINDSEAVTPGLFPACLTVSCKHLLIVSSTDHVELAPGDYDQVAILANLARRNNTGKNI